MAKLTGKVRQELLEILKRERKDERCKICKELAIEGKELTAEIDKKLSVLKLEVRDLEHQREHILEAAMLSRFDRYQYSTVCVSDVLHPKLIKFDEETDEMIKELLNR